MNVIPGEINKTNVSTTVKLFMSKGVAVEEQRCAYKVQSPRLEIPVLPKDKASEKVNKKSETQELN